MICNYCGLDAIEDTGMFNSEENSPEIHFWHCQDCGHTWMSEDQEEELRANLK